MSIADNKKLWVNTYIHLDDAIAGDSGTVNWTKENIHLLPPNGIGNKNYWVFSNIHLDSAVAGDSGTEKWVQENIHLDDAKAGDSGTEAWTKENIKLSHTIIAESEYDPKINKTPRSGIDSTNWVNDNIILQKNESRSQIYNIILNKSTFNETRFSSDGDIVYFNQPKTYPFDKMITKVGSFNYLDYNKENIPSEPIYRNVGQKLGSNQVEIEVNSRALDALRITNWMFNTGKGVKWVNEQIGLQMSNPNVEKFILSPFSQNRVYIPAKTLLSVAFAGTGIRFQRSGVLGMEYRYEDVIKNNQSSFGDFILSNNRLIKLGKELNIFTESVPGKDWGSLPGNVFSTLTGIGGPDSIFGVGVTVIRSAEKKYGPFSENDFKNQISSPAFTYSEIIEQREQNNKNKIIDVYKNGIDDSKYGEEVTPRSMPDPNKGMLNILEADMENQLKGVSKISNYVIKTYNQLNKIASSVEATTKRDTSYKEVDATYLGTIFGKNPDTGVLNKQFYTTYSKYVDPFNNDMFVGEDKDFKGITIKRMDKTNKTIKFKAFIESIGDAFSPKWNDVTYIGRPDTFRIYTGVTRTINLTFLLVDFTGDLSGENTVWSKANEIARFCSPNFTSNDRMISPVLKLTVLDLFDEVGYIDNLTIGIENNYPWNLNPVNSTDPPSVKPMIASITITFQSMMDKIPSYTAQYYKSLD